jgi:hypothetical protein
VDHLANGKKVELLPHHEHALFKKHGKPKPDFDVPSKGLFFDSVLGTEVKIVRFLSSGGARSMGGKIGGGESNGEHDEDDKTSSRLDALAHRVSRSCAVPTDNASVAPYT